MTGVRWEIPVEDGRKPEREFQLSGRYRQNDDLSVTPLDASKAERVLSVGPGNYITE